MNRSYALLLALLASTVSVFAQLATNTSIVGRVADSTGASIAEAQITARNQDTGEVLTATTNELGNYEFQFLKAGTYSVTVQKTGFSTMSQKDLALSANQTVRADFTVQVGSVGAFL